MNRLQHFLCLGLMALAVNVQSQEPPQLKQAWLTQGLRTPESVLFYQGEKDSFLFVSEIEGEAAGVDGKGGIAKLSLDGQILDQDWVRGLNAPKGMAWQGNLLFVADITDLVAIAIDSGEIAYRVPVPGASFLNDVAVSARGEVFVSDTRTNKVYRIVEREVETWLEDATSANGLFTLGSNLVVGAGDTLWLVDSDRTRHPLAKGFEAAIDGIEMAAPGEFLVSCWVGLLYYVHADGRLSKLLDSRDPQVNTADIGYNFESKVVYVPNFLKNSVTAYRLR
jgi:hypothetical protein